MKHFFKNLFVRNRNTQKQNNSHNSMKVFLLLFMLSFFLNSCDEKPLQDDQKQSSESLHDLREELLNATQGLTPLFMHKNEWALFHTSVRLYTGPEYGLGYNAVQVLNTRDSSFDYNGESIESKNIDIVTTSYKEPENGNTSPVIDVQKEWNCVFVKPPYYQWYGDCELPPFQNFFLFYPLNEPTQPIFFNLRKYVKKESLPAKMVQENRCFGFEDCKINVTYLEFDLITANSEGADEKTHYLISFSPDLPYLASNLKTCNDRLVEIEGKKHPATICQELLDFDPGEL